MFSSPNVPHAIQRRRGPFSFQPYNFWLELFAYIGFVERAPSRGAVFYSLAAIHPDEGVVSIHRKLKTTYFERMVWADGDAHGPQVHQWKEFWAVDRHLGAKGRLSGSIGHPHR